MIIYDLLISKPDIDRFYLTWRTDGSPQPGGITNIHRSNSPDGPYDIIASIDEAQNFYEDTPNVQSKSRTWYYKVENGNVTLGPISVSGSIDRISNYIAFLESRALERSLGIDCYVFIKKTTGERCPDCYDDVLGRTTDPQCTTCLGTGFVDGYFDPIQVKIAFPSNPVIVQQVEDAGEMQSVQVSNAWMGNYPAVTPGDIVIRDMDKTVWQVENPVFRSAKRHYLIRQTINLTQLDIGSSEYRLIERIM